MWSLRKMSFLAFIAIASAATVNNNLLKAHLNNDHTTAILTVADDPKITPRGLEASTVVESEANPHQEAFDRGALSARDRNPLAGPLPSPGPVPAPAPIGSPDPASIAWGSDAFGNVLIQDAASANGVFFYADYNSCPNTYSGAYGTEGNTNWGDQINYLKRVTTTESAAALVSNLTLIGNAYIQGVQDNFDPAVLNPEPATPAAVPATDEVFINKHEFGYMQLILWGYGINQSWSYAFRGSPAPPPPTVKPSPTAIAVACMIFVGKLISQMIAFGQHPPKFDWEPLAWMWAGISAATNLFNIALNTLNKEVAAGTKTLPITIDNGDDVDAGIQVLKSGHMLAYPKVGTYVIENCMMYDDMVTLTTGGQATRCQ